MYFDINRCLIICEMRTPGVAVTLPGSWSLSWIGVLMLANRRSCPISARLLNRLQGLRACVNDSCANRVMAVRSIVCSNYARNSNLQYYVPKRLLLYLVVMSVLLHKLECRAAHQFADSLLQARTTLKRGLRSFSAFKHNKASSISEG